MTKHTLTRWFVLAALAISIGPIFSFTGEALAADDVVVMIVELISGSDSDMRALALQQIREEAPGKSATKQFASLLPDLSPEVQVRLLDALGERGDSTARTGVLEMLSSKTETVRIATIQALAGVGDAEDALVLAKTAATGSDAEKDAARESLRLLSARKTNSAIVKALKNADANIRVELIHALESRNADETLPHILKHADNADLDVRLAMLGALKAMATEKHTEAVVGCIVAAKEKTERKQAELALLAVCSRGKTECADAVIDGFNKADAGARLSLMRGLAVAGGKKALQEIVIRLKDEDEDVRGEAVRVLAGWHNRAAVPHLKTLAADVTNLRNHVLAIRGIVRLAAPGKNRAADLTTLAEALQIASRKQERTLVLGALGTIPTAESLALVTASLEQPALVEDASLAAVHIAENIKGGDKDSIGNIMKQVAESAKTRTTRDRATKVLESL
jgi:HEAT repeat protein